MNCEQYQEHISRFIDDESDSAGESSLFHHLSTCDECREFLKEALNLRSELLINAAPNPSTKLDSWMRQALLSNIQLPYDFPFALERSSVSRFLPIAISVITIALLWGVLVLPSTLLQNANTIEATQTANIKFMMKPPSYNSPVTVQTK